MASAIKITLIPPAGEKIEQRFEGHSVTIGRSKSCTFTVESESLSRQHGLIELVNGEFYITDLGSTNGIYIEGNRIEPHRRIRFNNFLSLQISNYDCQVVELEDETYTPAPNSGKLQPHVELAPTKPTKKLNFHALNAPLPQGKQVKKESSKTRTALYLIILLMTLAAVFFTVMTEEEAQVTPEEKVLTPAARAKMEVAKIATPNAFHKDYETLLFAKDCKEGSFCRQLGLSKEEGEGLYEQGKEIFVFLRPSRHQLEKYAKLSPENLELIALDRLFNSIIMDAYFRGIYEHIHLVLISPTGAISKILRFHLSKYNLQTSQLETVITLIQKGLETNDLKTLSEILYPQLDILSLETNK
jgi:hypothetical protein